MTDKKTKTFSIDPTNFEEISDADNASAIVNDLLTQWRQGDTTRETVALELRLEEKKREKEVVEKRLEMLEQDIQDLEETIEKVRTGESTDMKKAREALAEVPRDPTNPAIENWAGKLGISPDVLVDRLDNHD